ncbi:hypothetical protein AB0E62_20615 [Streptomyces sp. NPDC038707]|uniref:hypothetical protein n=1 Tax=unclassified Streptomyces TaxID=2593676 RepID=UPI0034038F18
MNAAMSDEESPSRFGPRPLQAAFPGYDLRSRSGGRASTRRASVPPAPAGWSTVGR